MLSRGLVASVLFPVLCLAQPPAGPGGPASPLIRQGSQLDLEGKTAEARAIFQKAIDTAPTPLARAQAQRAMAMSWAFDGNCAKTAEYEEMVIAFWKTQESASPQNAFYQQGEMANEAARVCIDNGELDAALALYRRGRELGLNEPDISRGRRDLWDFRWEHAQARLAARRGDKAAAERHAALAAAVLENMKEHDPRLHQQQERFLPYLAGYIALYTGDPAKALAELEKANQNDAFIQCLTGMAHEKLGHKDKAMDLYRKAAAFAGHNPPAAFARPFTRKKLAGN